MNRIHEGLEATARRYPDTTAILSQNGEQVTYAQLDRIVDEAAAVLRDKNVRGGDRVAVAGENSVAMVAFVLACSHLDAWAIPTNARMAAGEIDRVIAHAEPRVIVTTDDTSDNAAAHGERLGAEKLAGSYGEVSITSTRECDPEPVETAPEDQVAVVMYTTGTTGDPKGVMLTHNNLLFAGNQSASLRGLTHGDRVYAVLPFSHIFGLASALTASLLAGATLQLETRFAPDKLYKALKDGITVLPAVPQMHALVMQHVLEQGLEKLDAPTLRYVSSGAAPLDPDWKRRAEAFYGVALQNGYGMTETTAGISTTRVAIGDPDISTGQPIPGTEVILIPPPEQDELKDGVGEILVRGPHVMKGYYKNRKETERTLRPDGFVHTGDLGCFDETGKLSVVGRCKELIIRGGFNIYPPEVEAAINDHPAVIQSAVIGRSVAGNEEVLAFVVVPTKDATSEADLKAHLKDRLAPYKHPSRIVLTKSLPAAATGKILKHKLVETFQDEL